MQRRIKLNWKMNRGGQRRGDFWQGERRLSTKNAKLSLQSKEMETNANGENRQTRFLG